jgi:hypothetical protein
MNTEIASVNREKSVQVTNGWVMLPVVILLMLGGLALFIYSIAAGADSVGHPFWGLFVLGILMEIAGILSMVGLFTLQPNEARVLLLFGAYKGTVRASGFWWGNPFYSNGARQGLIAAQMAAVEAKLATAKGARQAGAQAGVAKAPSRHKISLRASKLLATLSGGSLWWGY